jgi:hypothetical protein
MTMIAPIGTSPARFSERKIHEELIEWITKLMFSGEVGLGVFYRHLTAPQDKEK